MPENFARALALSIDDSLLNLYATLLSVQLDNKNGDYQTLRLRDIDNFGLNNPTQAVVLFKPSVGIDQ